MKVRALQTLVLGPGTVLTLSGRQASRRAHALTHIGGDRYCATSVVEFKAGEELGVEGELPKALAAVVDAGGGAPKRARRRPGAAVDVATLVIE